QITTDVAGERTSVPELAGTPRPGRLLVNDQELSYAKVRLDEHSSSNLEKVIAGCDDAFTRAELWNLANGMVRDGDMPMERSLSLLEEALPHDPAVALLDPVLRFADAAVDQYAPSDEYARARRRLT